MGHPYHTRAPASVFVHFPPIIRYLLYKHLYFQSLHYFSIVTFGRPTSLFWPTATHVTLGWSTTYHPPLLASSISSKYPIGHLPLLSIFVHLVPPLAQLIPGLVSPLTLDLVERLRPLFLSHILQPRVVLSLPTYWLRPCTSATSSPHLVDFTKPLSSGSRVPLLFDISTSFPKGRQYLDSHYPPNERSRTAQGETQFLPVVVDPHNIRRQHIFMLRWVLLCDYCS